MPTTIEFPAFLCYPSAEASLVPLVRPEATWIRAVTDNPFPVCSENGSRSRRDHCVCGASIEGDAAALVAVTFKLRKVATKSTNYWPTSCNRFPPFPLSSSSLFLFSSRSLLLSWCVCVCVCVWGRHCDCYCGARDAPLLSFHLHQWYNSRCVAQYNETESELSPALLGRRNNAMNWRLAMSLLFVLILNHIWDYSTNYYNTRCLTRHWRDTFLIQNV